MVVIDVESMFTSKLYTANFVLLKLCKSIIQLYCLYTCIVVKQGTDSAQFEQFSCTSCKLVIMY